MGMSVSLVSVAITCGSRIFLFSVVTKLLLGLPQQAKESVENYLKTLSGLRSMCPAQLNTLVAIKFHTCYPQTIGDITKKVAENLKHLQV